MNKLLNIFISVLMLPLFLHGQNPVGIRFQQFPDWSTVQAQAKKENKYIFIDMFTTWCGPCKLMDLNTYPDTALGKFMNDNYISLKIQNDSTKTDDNYVKSWYDDSKQVSRSAQVDAFPTLLFYSPNGELLMKTIGYKTAAEVINIAKYSGDTTAAKQFNEALTKYNQGIRDYNKMIELSRTVKQVLKDPKLAKKIAMDFKVGYLDTLNIEQFNKLENLQFIIENNLLVTNDKFFSLCYNKPEIIDSLFGQGTANHFVKFAINKSDIEPRLYENKKPIIEDPDWEALEKNLIKQYPKIHLRDFIVERKIAFYRRKNDWDKYLQVVMQSIYENPPKVGTDEVFYRLNGSAWEVFQYCDSRKALKKALKISNMSIKLENNVQYLDTKANLLYKLNNVAKAISLQEEALRLDRVEARKMGRDVLYSYISENLEKMKKGEPTWIVN